MRRHIVLSSLALCAAAAFGNAAAAEFEFYWGAKAGFLDADFPGSEPALNVGGYAGMPLELLGIEGVALEGELTTTAVDGEVATLDFSATTLAAYGVWRSPGTWYFKGKAGALYESIDVGSGSASDTGLSLGVGLGYTLSGGQQLEFELTQVEEDILMLSVGYTF